MNRHKFRARAIRAPRIATPKIMAKVMASGERDEIMFLIPDSYFPAKVGAPARPAHIERRNLQETVQFLVTDAPIITRSLEGINQTIMPS